MFGKPEEILRTIGSWGIREVELVETRSSAFIPGVLKLPFMVGTLGLITGRK
jgi:hypothetical protein